MIWWRRRPKFTQMRPTIIAAENFTFSSNPPRFAGRSRRLKQAGWSISPPIGTTASTGHARMQMPNILDLRA
jgi:hypothetical protein